MYSSRGTLGHYRTDAVHPKDLWLLVTDPAVSTLSRARQAAATHLSRSATCNAPSSLLIIIAPSRYHAECKRLSLRLDISAHRRTPTHTDTLLTPPRLHSPVCSSPMPAHPLPSHPHVPHSAHRQSAQTSPRPLPLSIISGPLHPRSQLTLSCSSAHATHRTLLSFSLSFPSSPL